MVQVVRGYLDGVENDTLRTDLGSGAADLAQVIPDLRERLPDIPPPAALPWEQARFSLFDSLTRCFRAAARRQPLVLVLDDLHWFDISSLLLLRFMTRASPDARLLLIGTYRDIGLDRHHPLVQIGGEVMGQPDSQTLTLEGLSGHEVASFIESATGQAPPPRLVTSITRETEGNPLFLTEVVRMLVAERRLSASESRDRPSFAVPHGVRAAIGRRLQGSLFPVRRGSPWRPSSGGSGAPPRWRRSSSCNRHTPPRAKRCKSCWRKPWPPGSSPWWQTRCGGTASRTR